MTGRGMRNQVKELESSGDAELLAAVREGNDAAFGELYRRHVGAGRAAARSLTRSSPTPKTPWPRRSPGCWP